MTNFRQRRLACLAENLDDLIQHQIRRLNICRVCGAYESQDVAAQAELDNLIDVQQTVLRMLEGTKS
jgi:hypothetical protein